MRNNLAITAARFGVESAEAQRLIASLKPNPTITLGAEQFDFGHPFRDLVTTNPNTAANRVYTYRWDQLIERGNKRKLRTEAAEFQLQAARAQVLDVTRQQLFNLKQAFYTAVLARENLRVADENLFLINSTEQLIKLHVEAGDSAEWDLIKFQTNKVQYQSDLVTAQLSYQQSVRDLLNYMGVQPSQVDVTRIISNPSQLTQYLDDAPLEVVGELGAKPIALAVDDLRQSALENRPDVIAAQHNFEAAQKNLDLARALRHRDFDVAGEYQREGGENTFGVTVSIPIFIHNNHQGDIDQAQAQLLQSKAQLEQAKLQVMTDVDKAFRAYQISKQLMGIYTTDALAKAEQSFQIAGVSYKEGATSLLELQDAQRTYNQTRVAYNQAHFNYRLSIYQLEVATGRKLL